MVKNRLSSHNGSTKVRPKLLTTLSTEDLVSVIEAQKLVEYELSRLKLLQGGISRLWGLLGKKYQLPKEFDLDTQSGEIFTKAGNING